MNKETARAKFSQAVSLIMDLGLFNIATSIFSSGNTAYTNDDKNPLMQLKLFPVTGKYLWEINERNVSVLHVNEVAFIIIHETLHYLLKHFDLIKDCTNNRCRNIAADIIVNDIIHDSIKDDNFYSVFKYKYYTGNNTIDKSSIGMSFFDVYSEVMKLETKPEQLTPPVIDMPDESSRSAVVKMIDGFPSGGDSGGGGSSTDKIIQQIVEEIETENTGMIAGHGEAFSGARLVNDVKLRAKFDRLFTKLFGKPIKRGNNTGDTTTWIKRPRSMLSIPMSKGVLPGFTTEPNKKYRISIYIDVSGSVSDDQIDMFSSLYNLIPKETYHISPYSFNEVVHGVPVTSNNKIGNIETGGGTSFDAVIKHIEEHNPDNSLIITDGGSSLGIRPSKPDRITWLIDANEDMIKISRLSLPGKVLRFTEIAEEIKQCL